jgi:eukaryotic translation initiation factor 2C
VLRLQRPYAADIELTLLSSHYDVEIDPVVKTLKQKKPKGLLRAVWEQVSLEQSGDWAEAFAAGAYDGRKNYFTPVPFPISRGKLPV